MLSTLADSSAERASFKGGARLNPWPTLLVVDADIEVASALVCFFEKRGFHVAAGTTLAEARTFLHRRKNWTLVISDYHLPDGNGVELCDWIRDQRCDAPVLLMSSSPHCASLCEGIEFLPKPCPLEKLEAYVRNVQFRGRVA
jgi:DNA-binding response OmpR family regulator